MNFRALENRIFETVFYPVVEPVLAVGFFIIGFGALRAKDPIGGLKTIGCILLAKSLVSLFVVALLIILASVGGGSDEAGESVAWMWSISHSVIFAIDLLFYFATYKIFGTIADKIRI